MRAVVPPRVLRVVGVADSWRLLEGGKSQSLVGCIRGELGADKTGNASDVQRAIRGGDDRDAINMARSPMNRGRPQVFVAPLRAFTNP